MKWSTNTTVEANAYHHNGVNSDLYKDIIRSFKLQPELDARVRKDGTPFEPFTVCSLLVLIQKDGFGKKIRSFLPQKARGSFAAQSLDEAKLKETLLSFGLTEEQTEAELDYYRHVNIA